MNELFFNLLMAAPAEGGATGGGFGTLLMFIPIIAIFYFLIIRPQSKRQKETQKMLSALKKGDRVVTIGGIHGTIQNVRETSVILKVDDSVKLEISRSAISSVTVQGRDEEPEAGDKGDSKEVAGSKVY